MKRASLVALGVCVMLAGAATLATWLIPKEGPATPTSERYAGLTASREARETSKPETSPPSVLASTSQIAMPEPQARELIAPVERIVIPKIGVDAQIVETGLTAGGALDVPNSPDLVAWYGFTAKPGMGGNAVMSGHVDYRGHGPAVFWDLPKLKPGDKIEVRLRDGNSIDYEVTAAESYAVQDVPMAEVIARTAQESLTLITCGGSFVDGHYTHRLVVRAARIQD